MARLVPKQSHDFVVATPCNQHCMSYIVLVDFTASRHMYSWGIGRELGWWWIISHRLTG